MKLELELTKEQQNWLEQETLRLLAEKQAEILCSKFERQLDLDEEFKKKLYNKYKDWIINSENKLFTSRFDEQINDISYFSDWCDTDAFKQAMEKRLVKTMETVEENKLKEQLEEAVKDYIESNSLEDILGEHQIEKLRARIAKTILNNG